MTTAMQLYFEADGHKQSEECGRKVNFTVTQK